MAYNNWCDKISNNDEENIQTEVLTGLEYEYEDLIDMHYDLKTHTVYP